MSDDVLRLTLGHSPDPDDAFMFYALAEGLLETPGLEFEHVLQDIETLNRRAFAGELDITAISVHAYAHVLDKYALLPHGASVGDGYGPRVVVRPESKIESLEDLDGHTVAVPGEWTTAYLALRLAATGWTHRVVEFDDIPRAVAEGEADAGLLIHEGQLTYEQDGLRLVRDLGEWWASENDGLPLPLGANAIRKDLGDRIDEISGILEASIRWSLDPEHRAAAVDHSLQYGRGLDRDLADEFVGMYVNERTLDLGDDGREAVRLLLRRGHEIGLLPEPVELEFAG